MQKPTVRCAVLAAMLAKHRWGTPIDDEALLSVTALAPGEYPTARDVIDDLRTAAYVVDHGQRGLALETGSFGALVEVLFHECGWTPVEIRSRLKHYEGWDNHDWA